MRIIGGRLGGLGLAPVGKGDAKAHLRPTTDRVRENLFNLLLGGRFGDPVTGAKVLDLFAGTGALGIEALSRGADEVHFVENGNVALRLLRANIKKAGIRDESHIHQLDATRVPPASHGPATLVFLDPPYGRDDGATALALSAERGWIANDALIAWEDGREQAPPPGFSNVDARRYGDTWLTLLTFDNGQGD